MFIFPVDLSLLQHGEVGLETVAWSHMFQAGQNLCGIVTGFPLKDVQLPDLFLQKKYSYTAQRFKKCIQTVIIASFHVNFKRFWFTVTFIVAVVQDLPNQTGYKEPL